MHIALRSLLNKGREKINVHERPSIIDEEREIRLTVKNINYVGN